MKKFITFLFALHVSLFTFHDTNAQWGYACLPEGITFTTQEQIDSFPVNYPGCIGIEGDVTINGQNITNLNGLNVLASIGGSLYIYDKDALNSLMVLESLTSIGGELLITSNNALTSLTGLENLTSIRVEADSNYSSFFMHDGRKIIVSKAMKEFEEALLEHGLHRIHKSHLVNIHKMSYLDKADGGFLVMMDGARVPVASRKRDMLMELFDGLE